MIKVLQYCSVGGAARVLSYCRELALEHKTAKLVLDVKGDEGAQYEIENGRLGREQVADGHVVLEVSLDARRFHE
jgi:hypothetical protein